MSEPLPRSRHLGTLDSVSLTQIMAPDLNDWPNSQCFDLLLENSPRLKSALRIPNRMKLGIPSFVANHKNTASELIYQFFTVSIRKISVNQIYQDRLPL